MSITPLSYVNGTSDKSLLYQTIGNALEQPALTHADHEALVDIQQNIRWTYHELNQRVDEIATGLLSLGLAPGDRVGVWSPNCAEWVLAQFATAKLGLIQVNINPAYRLHELEYVLNKVGCKSLITAAQFKTGNYIAMLQELAPELDDVVPGQLQSKKLPVLRSVIRFGDEKTPGFYNFDDLYNLGEPVRSVRRRPGRWRSWADLPRRASGRGCRPRPRDGRDR